MNPTKPEIPLQVEKPPMPKEGLIIVKDGIFVAMISDMANGEALMKDDSPEGYSLVKVNVSKVLTLA